VACKKASFSRVIPCGHELKTFSFVVATSENEEFTYRKWRIFGRA